MAERRFNRNQHENETSDEFPPYSRLFILCSKEHTEDEFRNHFSKYGTIDDVWLVKNRASGESRGLVYVKFSKTSEAATALEDMNGKMLSNGTKPIKVMVASSKYEGQARDNNDSNKYVRLFVMIPKTMSETGLQEEFSKFGKVESAFVIKDRESRESKGYGYVKYKYFSEAANAYENADKKYKAIFAEPKKHKSSYDSNSFESFPRSESQSAAGHVGHAVSNYEPYTRLSVICSPACQQSQICKLFDIVPGLDFCQFKVDVRRNIGVAQITYASHQSAKYAKEKLHGFEYPPGTKLVVKPEYDNNRPHSSMRDGQSPPELSTVTSNIKTALLSGAQNVDLVQLTESISQVSSLIQAAVAGTLTQRINTNEDSFCSVKLPPAKPLAGIDDPVARRWFLVFQPQPPPILMLHDAFSRFGDLIDVYTLRHKSVGYVKYASVQSADDARKTLHGAEIYGTRIKVLEAEEPRNQPSYSVSGANSDTSSNNNEHYDDRRKRLKIENSNNN